LRREELEYGAQEVINPIQSDISSGELSQLEKAVVERVKHEFENLAKRHTEIVALEFNDDDKYKNITTEAIELKSLARKKLDLFVQLYDTNDEKRELLLQQVIDTPILDFAKEGLIMELITGIRGFPWAQLADKKDSADFGEWMPEGWEASKLEAVTAALMKNEELRTVTVGANKDRLLFNDGWATATLGWNGSKAVQASVSITAFLLQCFTCLSSLDLR
jgi:hypothetical protein